MAQHTQEVDQEGNFLMEVEEDPRRKSVLLNLAVTNQEGQVKDKKAGSSLGCSRAQDLHGGSKALRTRILNFLRDNFG